MSSKKRFEVGKYYINPYTEPPMRRILITKVGDDYINDMSSADNYTKIYFIDICKVSPCWVELTDELKAELL